VIKPSYRKTLLITLGDPNGIGPEIIEKALKTTKIDSKVIILGNIRFYNDKKIKIIDNIRYSSDNDISLLEIDSGNNDPSFAYVKNAVSLLKEGKADAVVTAPISKEKWINTGNKFMGHTDYLVQTTNTTKWAMFFWSEFIKTALFTTHIPLKNLFGEIKKEKIKDFCRFVDSRLTKLTGKKFSFLMSGLNPHSGESGTIGTEESEEIAPAVYELKKEINIEGPFPPDTVFIKAKDRENSVIISLYHDQGLIPFKLLNINSGVNLTLGLPFIRTSPDHGTAYDIAGKNIANPGSISEAIKLADKLIEK